MAGTAPTPVGDLGFTMTEHCPWNECAGTVGSDCLVEGYLPLEQLKQIESQSSP